MHRHCFVNTVDIGKRKELCIQLELYARQKSFRHICKIVPKKPYPFKSCFMKALKKSIIYPRLGPLISSGFIQRFTSLQPLGHGGVNKKLDKCSRHTIPNTIHICSSQIWCPTNQERWVLFATAQKSLTSDGLQIWWKTCAALWGIDVEVLTRK